MRAFADEREDAELQRLRVRSEDKQAIAAFHWRGAPDEQAAEHAAASGRRAAREDAGWRSTGAARCSRFGPPLAIDKGRGVRLLLDGRNVSAALYVGDDVTDLDAFAGLRALVDEGRLETAVCVGVRSDETPAQIEERADVLVDGTLGVRELLMALAT